MSKLLFICLFLYIKVFKSVIIPVEIIENNCHGDFKIGGLCKAPLRNGVPVVNVKVGSWPEPIKFVLDSGSDSSYVIANNVKCYSLEEDPDEPEEEDCDDLFLNETPNFMPSGVPIAFHPEDKSQYSSLNDDDKYQISFAESHFFGCYNQETVQLEGTDYQVDLAIGVIDVIFSTFDKTEELGLLGLGARASYEDNFLWKYYQMSNRESAMIGFGLKCKGNAVKALFSIGEQIGEFSTNGETGMANTPAATILYDLRQPVWAFKVKLIEINHIALDTGLDGSLDISQTHYETLKQQFTHHSNGWQVTETDNNTMIVTMTRREALRLNPHFEINVFDEVTQRRKQLTIPKEAILKENKNNQITRQLEISNRGERPDELMFGIRIFAKFYTEILLGDFHNNMKLRFYEKDDCQILV